MEHQVICIDCEAQWNPNGSFSTCLCDDPRDDAWILYEDGEWEGVYRETYY